MGGYGAIISLSGALHVMEKPEGEAAEPKHSPFGNMAQARRSDKNPSVQTARLKERMKTDSNAAFPRMYLACGTETGCLWKKAARVSTAEM